MTLDKTCINTMAIVVIKHTSIAKYKPKTSILTRINGKEQINPKCYSMGCIVKPISRCTLCSNYYCYEHVYEHPHAMENVEIL